MGGNVGLAGTVSLTEEEVGGAVGVEVGGGMGEVGGVDEGAGDEDPTAESVVEGVGFGDPENLLVRPEIAVRSREPGSMRSSSPSRFRSGTGSKWPRRDQTAGGRPGRTWKRDWPSLVLPISLVE